MNRKQKKRKQAKRRRSVAAAKPSPDRAGLQPAADATQEQPPSPEELAEFQAELRQLGNEAPQRIAGLQEELIEVLAPFDAFDILANAWTMNTPLDPNTYRETEQTGLLAIPDFLLLLCAQRPSRAPTVDGEGGRLIDGPILDQIDGLVREILELTNLHLALKLQSARDAIEELRGRLLARRMFVQGPGFEFQGRELLAVLFGSEKIQAALVAGIGFTEQDALAISDGLEEASLSKFSDRSRDGRSLPELLKQALRNDETELLNKLGLPLEQLAEMADGEREQALDSMGAAFTFSALGSTMQVTVAEVAAQSGVAAERVQQFFDVFSIGFGEPSERLMGTAVLRARERPIITDGQGNYLLVSPLALLWAIRPALEDSLKGGPAWHPFERARAEHVEAAALDHFQSALPGSKAYRSVTFEVDEDGTKVRYEIDGLLICDTVMLVIEGKSGSLSAAGRKGSPARLGKHLRDILVKAAEQAGRARRTLDQRDSAFFTEDGEQLQLPPQVSEIFPIVVTLEDLSEVTTVIWELEEAGLLPENVPTPWALSLFELELISDLTEYAAMLIHFLRRRARLNVLKRVRASDELDWWIYYLEHGLYFEGEFEQPEAPDIISLGSMTDPVDAYYFYKQGLRTDPAPKPRQELPSELRALLDTLHDRARSGYLEASVALLDLDDEARTELMRNIRECREKTEADGEFHNMSMLVHRDGSLGITFMASPDSGLDRLENRLGLYAIAKKHQTRLRRWVMLGWCAGTPHLLDIIGVMIGDWRADPNKDELLEDMGLDQSAPLSDTDGSGSAGAEGGSNGGEGPQGR
jgi:hypothetical protein